MNFSKIDKIIPCNDVSQCITDWMNTSLMYAREHLPLNIGFFSYTSFVDQGSYLFLESINMLVFDHQILTSENLFKRLPHKLVLC